MTGEGKVTPGEAKAVASSAKGTRKNITWDESTRALLEDWHLRTTRAQFGHQMQAEKTRGRNLFLGIPVVIFTTVVGTGAFAAINDSTTNFWKLAAGVVSILAAVLASVQTFLGYGERSDRHRVAATRYASTRRSIELALTTHNTEAVPFIKGEMDRIGGASPQIDRKIWDEARGFAEEAIAARRRGEAPDLEEPPPKHALKQDARPTT